MPQGAQGSPYSLSFQKTRFLSHSGRFPQGRKNVDKIPPLEPHVPKWESRSGLVSNRMLLDAAALAHVGGVGDDQGSSEVGSEIWFFS